MLEEWLLDRRWLLAALVLVFAGSNIALAMYGQRLLGRQMHIKQQSYPPLGFGDRTTRKTAGKIFLPLVFATIMSGFALLPDRQILGAATGGFLVMEVVGASISVGSCLNLRSLQRPRIAVGELTYSAEYRYAATSHQLLAAALVVWLGFAMRGGTMLLGGGAFLLALASGHRKRARQARQLGLTVEKPGAA